MNHTRLLGLLFFFVASTIAQAQDPKAAAILEAMSKKYKSLNSFSAAFTYGGAGENLKGDITTKAGKYKLQLAGQEIYNDGKTVATYVKDVNEVNISSHDASESEFSPATIYSIYQKGYKYSLVGEKDGNAIIDLIPENKKASVSKVQLTIAKKDYSLKSWQITDKSGRKQQFRINKFTPNVAVTDQAFTFNKSKYPGVEVVDLRN